LKRLYPCGLTADLCVPKRPANAKTHRFRKIADILPARPDPADRLRENPSQRAHSMPYMAWADAKRQRAEDGM
jgi:hypothetical protein